MREVKRGFHYPTVAELCAVADSTGMHPILTRRFENRLQQGLSADGRNAEVLADLAEIDDHLLPFLNPIQIVLAVTELPTGGYTEGARWRLLARCVTATVRVPLLIESLTDTPTGDVLVWTLIARADPTRSLSLLEALETRGSPRFLAAAADAVCAQRGTLLSTVSREGSRAAANRWVLVGRLLLHASDPATALSTVHFFTAAGVDVSPFAAVSLVVNP